MVRQLCTDSKNGGIRLRNLATSSQVSAILFLSNESKLYIMKNLLFLLPPHNFPKKENENINRMSYASIAAVLSLAFPCMLFHLTQIPTSGVGPREVKHFTLRTKPAN